ncbi:MAG: tripartite tricarboxylate transporter TctB family protein [Propionivibrio sp.]
MRFNDAVLGAIIAAFAVCVIAIARTFPELPGQDYGPAFFPTVIGGILLICGAILIAKGYATRHQSRWVALGAWSASPGHIANLILVPVAIIVYIFAADDVGFIPIACAVLFVLLFRFGISLIGSLVLAVVTTLVIHTVFYKYLLVPLPWGLLEPFAW